MTLSKSHFINKNMEMSETGRDSGESDFLLFIELMAVERADVLLTHDWVHVTTGVLLRAALNDTFELAWAGASAQRAPVGPLSTGARC